MKDLANLLLIYELLVLLSTEEDADEVVMHGAVCLTPARRIGDESPESTPAFAFHPKPYCLGVRILLVTLGPRLQAHSIDDRSNLPEGV
jgi:hypothetical protein